MILSALKELLSLPTANGHASCAARVNSETWVVWFGGTKEGHPDVKIYFSRKTASGWTEPLRICFDEALPHWNPVLMPRGDGADLFFKVGVTIPGWRTMRVHIGADGVPQGEIREVVPGDVGGRGPVRNKCLTLADGRVLAPASIETDEPTAWKDAACAQHIAALPSNDAPIRWKPFIDISSDGGETFSQVAPIPLHAASGKNAFWPVATPAILKGSDARAFIPCRIRRQGAIQPALWQSADGSIHALMRSSESCILRSDSTDGIAWTPACTTSLPNNNSGIDLAQMPDGRILLCLNPVSGDWAARTPLWLYVSANGGDTFKPLTALEMNDGEYSYPSLTCEGNTVYLTYTWKRVAIAVWTIELEPLP